MANEIFSRFIGIRYLHVYAYSYDRTPQYMHLSAPSRSVSILVQRIFHESTKIENLRTKSLEIF